MPRTEVVLKELVTCEAVLIEAIKYVHAVAEDDGRMAVARRRRTGIGSVGHLRPRLRVCRPSQCGKN